MQKTASVKETEIYILKTVPALSTKATSVYNREYFW